VPERLDERAARALALGQHRARQHDALPAHRRLDGDERLIELDARDAFYLRVGEPRVACQPGQPVRVQRVVQQRCAVQVLRLADPVLARVGG